MRVRDLRMINLKDLGAGYRSKIRTGHIVDHISWTRNTSDGIREKELYAQTVPHNR